MSGEIKGLKELVAFLRSLSTTGVSSVAASMLGAAGSVYKARMKSVSPGQVSLEIGYRRQPTQGHVFRAIVGLGVGRAEARVKRPHGHFLAKGTRFISPRGFIRDAAASASGSAKQAAVSAGKRRLAKLQENAK